LRMASLVQARDLTIENGIVNLRQGHSDGICQIGERSAAALAGTEGTFV